MKVHPMARKRNIAFRYDTAQTNASVCRQKKLRRLPHIFAKVLELPFHSDADVSIEETDSYFRFVVSTDDVGNDVRAHTLEIYPGVTKILIKEDEDVGSLLMDGLELDMWRFRLPDCTVPEMATAVYSDGELIVTIPKGDEGDNDGEDGDVGEEAGHLVLVQ